MTKSTLQVLMIATVVIAGILWLWIIANGQEELTDSTIFSPQFTEKTVNLRYEWESKMTASVPGNFCNNCMAQAEDDDTRLMCYNLFCQ